MLQSRSHQNTAAPNPTSSLGETQRGGKSYKSHAKAGLSSQERFTFPKDSEGFGVLLSCLVNHSQNGSHGEQAPSPLQGCFPEIPSLVSLPTAGAKNICVLIKNSNQLLRTYQQSARQILIKADSPPSRARVERYFSEENAGCKS